MTPIEASLDVLQGEERGHLGMLLPNIKVAQNWLNKMIAEEGSQKLKYCTPLAETLPTLSSGQALQILLDRRGLLARRCIPSSLQGPQTMAPGRQDLWGPHENGGDCVRQALK